MLFNLLTITLKASFTLTLHRLIGLNALIEEGFSSLGISTRKDSFDFGHTSAFSNVLFTKSTNAGPVVFQVFWKNIAGKPSGPEALRGDPFFAKLPKFRHLNIPFQDLGIGLPSMVGSIMSFSQSPLTPSLK